MPFSIVFDSTNQPELEDSTDSPRLKKRPDFLCILINEQAINPQESQVTYTLECKRLGQAESSWVLNENYSEFGMRRFMEADHSYAKGCSSATLIGYVQNMELDDVLAEVNSHAEARKIPSLTRAAKSWVKKGVTDLSNQLPRDFSSEDIHLNHAWVDLRHCAFEKPVQKAAVTITKKTAKTKRTGKNSTRKSAKKKT